MAPNRDFVVTLLVKWILGAALALVAVPTTAGPARRPILYDPVALNIGIGCQWETGCMQRHHAAMARALTYVATRKPAPKLVHLCNRNASRGGGRVDWIGYDHCIRNPALKRRANR